jgi:NAD/NADP transhydrogenase beta subunit
MREIPLTTAAVAVGALVLVGGIVAFGALVDVQAAVLMLAGVALLAAVARLALPATRVFTVRRRAVDVSIMLAFALVLAVLGLTTAAL